MTVDLNALRTALSSIATTPNEISLDQLPVLVADLARAQAALLIAASHRSASVHRDLDRPADDRMLGAGEAAAMLGVSVRWLYRHAKQLPFTRPIAPKIV